MEEIKKNDDKKDEKKDDKKDDKKNKKSGLPLLHKFELYDSNIDMKAITVRANRL